MAVAEGEEQRPVWTGKLVGCVSGILYVVGVPILLLGLLMSIGGDDGFIPFIVFAFIASFVLLPARMMRRYRNISAWVYSDHLITKKCRWIFPGTKIERLDYRDIKKVKEITGYGQSSSLLLDILFAVDTYKVYRFDGSKIRLPFSGDISYRLFEDYCRNYGIEIISR